MTMTEGSAINLNIKGVSIKPVKEGDLVLLIERTSDDGLHGTLLEYDGKDMLFKKDILHLMPSQNGAFSGAIIPALHKNTCMEDYVFKKALDSAEEIYVGRDQVINALQSRELLLPYLRLLESILID
jgi:hypothetical protein